MATDTQNQNSLLLRTEDLCKVFTKSKGMFSRKQESLRAVHRVSIEVREGETVGLVGESGCGKTTLGRTVLRLYEPDGGKIFFDGQDITHLRKGDLRSLRRSMQAVFQDPYSSLNPRFRVKDIIAEGLVNFQEELKLGKEAIREKVSHILEKIGLAKDAAEKFPHQFSGGQRQRIGVGRAIALSPKFIVCDEPLSALDVSIKSQVLNLLLDLKTDLRLSYLFISHDLKITSSICNRIYIMYLGEVVEELPSRALFEAPLHPYTQALISAVPELDPAKKRSRIVLEGDVPSPVNIPPGCPFHPRCPKVMDICRREKPSYSEKKPGQKASCWLHK